MIVAPSFFLIGLFLLVGFLGVTLIPAIFLAWLGKNSRLFRINNPFRAIYLTAGIAFVVRAIIAAPQMAIASNVQGVEVFIPPYLICFFIVGFIVFSRRLDSEHYGKKEAIISAGISLACVLWYLLVELAVYTYIGKT
ncbi:hypothetical protein CWE12_07050 [Aliidiomarina sedimenti]|uniref:DUF4345 domain-containing protein n=1 Tax=Aliidiomarina sedimenti TaxID=1933879 RepID=A0ABY0BY83_9GAMM|nr:hypothetical protein [Aliidiomarina sedimenti]RUO29721.1 hypothetical protein CWE12_07050 [Aliidiomarina sedimenti]